MRRTCDKAREKEEYLNNPRPMLPRIIHGGSSLESAKSRIGQHVYVSDLVFKGRRPQLLKPAALVTFGVLSPTAPPQLGNLHIVTPGFNA